MRKRTEGKPVPKAVRKRKAKSATALVPVPRNLDPSEYSYHLWVNEAAIGPFTIRQLRATWNSGQITGETRYTIDAGESWHDLTNIIGDLEPTVAPIVEARQIAPRKTQSPPSYHLWLDDAAKGPFTIGQLRGMWNSGQITLETCYTTDAGENWRDLSDIIGGFKPTVSPIVEARQIVRRIETSETTPSLLSSA